MNNKFKFIILIFVVTSMIFYFYKSESENIRYNKLTQGNVVQINKKKPTLKLSKNINTKPQHKETKYKGQAVTDKNDDRNELMKAAYKSQFNKLKNLIRSGENINAQDKEGMTALMYSIQSDNLKGFHFLLKNKANIDILDLRNSNALVMASSGGNLEMLNTLLNLGADPNIIYNQRNFTLLMDASFEGDIDRVKILLDNDASINAIDKEGLTSISYAVREGHKSVVIELLKHKPNLSLKDKNGKTALDYAVNFEFNDIVEILK